MNATRQPCELPCSSCHVSTAEDLLTDASERAAFLGLVCPACEDALTAEEHAESSEGPCQCEPCTRVAVALERERSARYAEAAGGLRSNVFDLFTRAELLGTDKP